MQKLNVSIVLYHNSKVQLGNVINSLLQTTVALKLFLIDNSTNDDLKCFASSDSRIEYIHTNANLGYGKAHNLAICNSIKEGISYHLVLNPDIILKNNVLEELVAFMDNNMNVGNVMPKIVYPDGSMQYLCKLLPTPVDLIFRRFVPGEKWKERRNEKYELRFTGYNKEMNIPNLSGCFMFLRTDILKEVGIFDDNIFMYLEDVDLNRRIHQKYKTIFYPGAEVIHEYNKESYKNRTLLKAHIKSALYYFRKWGWFFDKYRKEVNKETLNKLHT